MSRSSWALVVLAVLLCAAWLALGTGVARVTIMTESSGYDGSGIRVNVGDHGYGYVGTGGSFYGPSAILVTRDWGALGVERRKWVQPGWHVIAERP